MDNKEIEKIKSLKEQLLNEFKLQDKSGIYAITQYNLAYNSNKIEGSRLTEKETANLFDTGTVFSNNSYYLAKDIEEARGHFLMFNEMLKTLDENLTHEIIKSYHYQLKSGVFEDKANGYAIGEYKTRNNIIAGYETVLVEDVDEEITRLLENYNQIKEKSLIDLLEFHINFEMIHPFQDGNGRVGRIILFKELLKNNIKPFIIQDKHKLEYYFSLNEYRKNNNLNKFIELAKKEQIEYEEIINKYLIINKNFQNKETEKKKRNPIMQKYLEEKKKNIPEEKEENKNEKDYDIEI